MDEKKPDTNRKRHNSRNYKNGSRQRVNRKNYPRDNRRDNRNSNRRNYHKPRKPRNIRYGTKFCGECRACKFWVEAQFGRFRCDYSDLPFEILEFRRDGETQQITEIVLNLLV
ncbi:MAG: hypothetical protein ACTSQI_19795 [Candidatus Helarchaeota archaeon]